MQRGERMPKRPMPFCRHPGCSNLTSDSFCSLHFSEQIERDKVRERKRASARQRGYTTRWDKYSKWFLSQPENQFCKLHLDDRCAVVAQCVDHIIPPSSPGDPLFWDRGNHQPACIHCNSVKGHSIRAGEFEFGKQENGNE